MIESELPVTYWDANSDGHLYTVCRKKYNIPRVAMEITGAWLPISNKDADISNPSFVKVWLEAFCREYKHWYIQKLSLESTQPKVIHVISSLMNEHLINWKILTVLP